MSEKKNGRRSSDQKKLKLVLESMESDTKIADICRRQGLSPNQLHQPSASRTKRPRWSERSVSTQAVEMALVTATSADFPLFHRSP